jgi:hypothetical protein
MRKLLDKTFRKDLISMLRQSSDAAHLELADELEAAGPHGYATDDEIEQFMEIV